jgi:Protein of unknown function (DUF2726)
MLIVLLIVLIVGGVAGSLYWIKKQARLKQELDNAALNGIDPDPSDDQWPFDARPVMSEQECVLLARLTEALPECTVLSQVRLSRLVRVRREDRRAFWENRIARENADFVVCDEEANVLAVIELDERGPEEAARARLDGPMERALRAARIPFLRWSTNDLPDPLGMRHAVLNGQSGAPAKAQKAAAKSTGKSVRRNGQHAAI